MKILHFIATALALGGGGEASAHLFAIVGDRDAIARIEGSLAACPSLAATLNDLAKASTLTGIRVTNAQETKGKGPFLAAVSGKEIILADEWLSVQNQPFSDVRQSGEILPDNLCFGLGHLAYHVAHPVLFTPPKSTSGDFTAWMKERMNAGVTAESRAFLAGWTVVLEAARGKTGGKALEIGQVGPLLMNLRYRFAFLGAMRPENSPQLQIQGDGLIPDTDQNVAAIVATLSNSTIADLE